MLIGNKQMLNDTSKMTTPVFLHDMCRVCMLTSDYLKDVVSYSLTPKLINMLNSIAGINANENDCLPSLICSSCYIRLRDSFEFRNLCVETNNTLQNFVSQMQCDALTIIKKSKVITLPLNLSLHDKHSENQHKKETSIFESESSNSVQIIDLEPIKGTKNTLKSKNYIQESSNTDTLIESEPSESARIIERILSKNKINVQKLSSSAQIIDRIISKNKALKPSNSMQLDSESSNFTEIIDLEATQSIQTTRNTLRNSIQIIEPEPSNSGQIIDLEPITPPRYLKTQKYKNYAHLSPITLNQQNRKVEPLESPIRIEQGTSNSNDVIDLDLLKMYKNLTKKNKVQSLPLLLNQDDAIKEKLSYTIQIIEPEVSNSVQIINLEPIKTTRKFIQKNKSTQLLLDQENNLREESTKSSIASEADSSKSIQPIKIPRNLILKSKITQLLPVSLEENNIKEEPTKELESSRAIQPIKTNRNLILTNKITQPLLVLLDEENNLKEEPAKSLPITIGLESSKAIQPIKTPRSLILKNKTTQPLNEETNLKEDPTKSLPIAISQESSNAIQPIKSPRNLIQRKITQLFSVSVDQNTLKEKPSNPSPILEPEPSKAIQLMKITRNSSLRNKSNSQPVPVSPGQETLKDEPSKSIEIETEKVIQPIRSPRHAALRNKNSSQPVPLDQENLKEEPAKSPVIAIETEPLKVTQPIKITRNLLQKNKITPPLPVLLDQESLKVEPSKTPPIAIESESLKAIKTTRSVDLKNMNTQPFISNEENNLKEESSEISIEQGPSKVLQPIKTTKNVIQKNNSPQLPVSNQENYIKEESSKSSIAIALEPSKRAQINDIEPIQPKITRNMIQKIKTQSLPVLLNHKDELSIGPEPIKATKTPRSPTKKPKDTAQSLETLNQANILAKETSKVPLVIEPESRDPNNLITTQILPVPNQDVKTGTIKEKSSNSFQIYEIVDLEPSKPIRTYRRLTPRNKNKPQSVPLLSQDDVKSDTKLEEQPPTIQTHSEPVQPIRITRNVTPRNKNRKQLLYSPNQKDVKSDNLEEASYTVETIESVQPIKNTRNVALKNKTQPLSPSNIKTGTILKEKPSNSDQIEPEPIQLKITRNSSTKKVKSSVKVFIKSELTELSKSSPKTKSNTPDAQSETLLKRENSKIDSERVLGIDEEPSAELLRALGLIKKSPDSTDVNSNETTPRIRKRRIIIDDDSDSSGYSSKSKKSPKIESSDDSKKFRKLFQCNVCTDEITEYGAYRRHLASHGELPFVCKICGKRFSQARTLKEHTENTHSGHRPYNCAKCNSRFKTLDELTIHLRRHAGNTSPYACQLCPFRSSSGRQLRDHSVTHAHERKPEEKFKRSATGSGSHSCRMCQRRFRKKCDLERHERVHSGEKPYVCVLCDGRFQQAHNLTKHMTKHTGVRSYTCDICNKTFGRSDVLARHMHVHEVSKPFSCGQCQRTFARQSQLDRHLEKKHSKGKVEVKTECLPVAT